VYDGGKSVEQVRNRLIVALDFATMAQVRELVESLGDAVSYYKVGMQLFYGVGMECLTYLREKGKDVFLDLKMHDIPNTVAQGAASLTRLGAAMINVQASGGPAMMRAAAKQVAETATALNIPRPQLIAVTVLTSMNDTEWAALRSATSIPEQVVHLAKLAQEAGLDGVVASPQEAERIREACGPDFAIVTPGVRPQGAALNDQSRVATPAEALKAGAHYLVIGRPITKAENPRAAALSILEEMRKA
jgi:orotidine-5'-phosphate decarboxylase